MKPYLRQVVAIVRKDLLIEVRSRDRVVAMGAFAVLAGVLFSFSLDTTAVRPRDVAAGLIWMTVVFGGLIGVGRTFHLEGQDSAFRGVLTSPAPKDAIFLGKVVSNFILLFTVAMLVFAIFSLFFGLEISAGIGWVILVLGLGSLGFVAVATLFSAVAGATTMGETLLPVLVFPLLLPMVVFGVGATGRLMGGRPIAEVGGTVRMLGAFAFGAVAVGAVLFKYVVEE